MDQHEAKIIDDIAVLLKSRYGGEGSGHDYQHLERVWKMARRLSEGENIDPFVIEAAALLHDVDDYKFRQPGDDELKNTKEILSQYDIPPRKKDAIYDIITHVSFKGGGGQDVQRSLEGKIVQDADRLDVLGAVGIARTFAYGGSRGRAFYDPDVKPRYNMTFEEYQKDSPSVNHLYEKVLLLKDRLNTPQAKRIAEHRHRFVEEFLEEFWKEIRGEL